jgi:hypothetical protein
LRRRVAWRYEGCEPEAAMPRIERFKTSVDVLNYEIVQEQASALGRLGRGLEAALADLQQFDAAHPRTQATRDQATLDQATLDLEARPEQRQARRALVDAAGHALWMFVVQREACGLRDSRSVMGDYKVPAEVQERMGVFPARKGEPL